MKNSITRKYLTTTDIAKICEVSPHMAVTWIDNKEIKAYAIGKHRRITVDNMRIFMQKYNIPIKWLNEFLEKKELGKIFIQNSKSIKC